MKLLKQPARCGPLTSDKRTSNKFQKRHKRAQCCATISSHSEPDIALPTGKSTLENYHHVTFENRDLYFHSRLRG